MVCRGCGAPVPLLYTLFDEFEFQGVRAGAGNNMTVQFRCQGALFDVLLCDWPTPGLHFDLTLVGSQNAYQLRGGFVRNAAGGSIPCWKTICPSPRVSRPPTIPGSAPASIRFARHLVSCLSGELTAEQAAEQGLFNLDRARAMESLFLPLWQWAGQAVATQSQPASSFDWKLNR